MMSVANNSNPLNKELAIVWKIMPSAATFYKKHADKHSKKVKDNISVLKQKRHFLICQNCFWMASAALPDLSDVGSITYKKCPICVCNIDRFLICGDSFLLELEKWYLQK